MNRSDPILFTFYQHVVYYINHLWNVAFSLWKIRMKNRDLLVTKLEKYKSKNYIFCPKLWILSQILANLGVLDIIFFLKSEEKSLWVTIFEKRSVFEWHHKMVSFWWVGPKLGGQKLWHLVIIIKPHSQTHPYTYILGYSCTW